jgi:alpha-galactosidase
MRAAGPFVLLAILVAVPASAAPIPVDLPPPAATPPAKDKPVKVYILSGQSNMVGFGAIKPAPSHYANIFLSADPSVEPVALPVGNALLVPFGLHPSAKASGEKGVLEAEIDVPFDGHYVVHPGSGPNSDCVAELDGKVIYRLDENGKAVRTKVTLEKGKRYPLRITSKQGGAAAFFLEQVDLRGYGDLGFVIDTLGRFRYLRNDDGSWVKRPDVILNDAYLGKGQSAPLSVEACGPTFGPELGFGFVMGTFHDEPVLVIKADIGNRSLGWDILPPGTSRYTFEVDGKEIVCPGYGENERTIAEGGKPRADEWYAGKQYDDYTAAVRAVLDNFGERYPEYAEQGYEVAGFAWWQGHKDGGNPAHVAHYEQNLVKLIKAWRKEFNAPNAKWVIATVGFHGAEMPEHYVKVAEAQLAVADPKRHPELAGTVKTIDTRPFWREPNISPKNQDYHYNHNAETYMLCGDSLGRAMAELEGGEAEYPTGGMTKPIDAPALLKPADPATLASMAPAITPIVMDRLLPEFAGEAASIPSYLRRGIPLDDILSGKAPAKKSPVIESQLDQMIDHYDLCGIRTYDWNPFGPEMKSAEWQYFTFDPPEAKNDPEGDRYRPVTLPAGMEKWFEPDFDAAKAGWKTGKAPFGQKDGKQEPLIASCKVPYCGCSVRPATLWDREVLLMRQTFTVPPLDEKHRYRIVVGGAGHAWSGEGFALYLNGKLVSEATGGYYKGGGQARGAIVYDDLLPEFAEGTVTIAVKAFLRRNGHRGKAAPPSGHMSVWMEAAELSPVAAEVAKRLKP